MRTVNTDGAPSCGVVVLASIIGKSPRSLEALIINCEYCSSMKRNGFQPSRMHFEHLTGVLEMHGFETRWLPVPKESTTRRFLPWFVKNADEGRALWNVPVILLLTGHFVLLHRGKVVDTTSNGRPVPIEEHKCKNKLVKYFTGIRT